MKFTNTDCVQNKVNDIEIFDLMDVELRWDMITQVWNQVDDQVYVHHKPIRIKIIQEIKK